jgi:peptidoglycan/xylan/chitin deacetylase (PgdA/CDA1 family)
VARPPRSGDRTAGAALAGCLLVALWAAVAPCLAGDPSGMSSGCVALAFEDGPGEGTRRLLDVLTRYGVTATFFVAGRSAERHPALLALIRRRGHAIANRGYSPGRGTRPLTKVQVAEELGRTQAVIARHVPRGAARYVCAPTSWDAPWITMECNLRGYVVIPRPLDARDREGASAGDVAQGVFERVRSGSVIMFRGARPEGPVRQRYVTPEAVGLVIEGLRARGYGFTSVQDALHRRGCLPGSSWDPVAEAGTGP